MIVSYLLCLNCVSAAKRKLGASAGEVCFILNKSHVKHTQLVLSFNDVRMLKRQRLQPHTFTLPPLKSVLDCIHHKLIFLANVAPFMGSKQHGIRRGTIPTYENEIKSIITLLLSMELSSAPFLPCTLWCFGSANDQVKQINNFHIFQITF